MNNPFDNRQKYPIMEYVAKLENKVRWLEWEATKRKAKSFVAGMMVGGIIIIFVWALVGLYAKGVK